MFVKFENIGKMVSVQFRKKFTGPPFCVGWTKNLQTFNRHFFWQQPSKYCIAKFTAIFVCLPLSYLDDVQWNELATSRARNFNNSCPLCLIFLNVINLCPNIWFIKNSKCQQFFYLKKEPPKKKHKFFIFLKGCYFVMSWPIDMNVDVFWETSVGVLKSVVLQLFLKYSQSNVNLNVNSRSKFNCL